MKTILLAFVFFLTLFTGTKAGACYDFSQHCKYYSKDYCHYWWMKENCPAFCGHCDGNKERRSADGQSGRPAVSPIHHITAGSDASQGAWPWQVQLKYSSWRHRCGGSIVNQRWIITAASCFSKSRTSSMYSVVAGEYNLYRKSGWEQTLRVSRIEIHPKYSAESQDYDVALLYLTSNIRFNKYVSPVPLTRYEPSPGTRCYVTGWGAERDGGRRSTVLQQAQVSIVSRTTCQRAYSDRTFTDSMICAGNAGGRVFTCQGDGGGPLVCKRGSTWYLSGLVSWIGCGQGDKYGVYTNVKHIARWVGYETD